MNTTMAPIVQIREDTLKQLPRHGARLRLGSLRRDSGNARNRGSGKRDDDSDGDGNNDEGHDNKDGNRGKPRNSKSDDDDDDGPEDHNIPPPPPPLPKVPAAAPPTISLSSTAAAIKASTTALIPSSTSISSTSSLETLISSLFPTTASPALPSVMTFTSLGTSTQPRKGLNTDEPGFPPDATPSSRIETEVTTITAWTSVTAAADTEPTKTPSKHHEKHDDLSPTDERILIGAGSIGAFIIIVGSIYLLTRMMKVDSLAFFRGRRFGRGGTRGWYGWRKDESMDYTSDPPPQYEGYVSDKKQIANRKSIYASETPVTGAALSRANSQQLQDGHETLINNPAPLGISEPAQTTPVSALDNFYNNTSATTQKTLLSRQISNGYDATARTQDTFLTQQTSNLYDPNQREVNHLSYLSSISSGFGDGLMIPEPVAQRQQPRQSTRQSRKFSWMVSSSRARPNGPAGDRDTVYTTASIETVPRFRTVNSWVAQQAGRVQKQFSNSNSREVPAIPAIPVKHQSEMEHSRSPSEDPAFRQHPGQEINISSGVRVPSAILNRKTGVLT